MSLLFFHLVSLQNDTNVKRKDILLKQLPILNLTGQNTKIYFKFEHADLKTLSQTGIHNYIIIFP